MALKVGILGVAHVHAPFYQAALQKHPDVKLIGFWERDPDLSLEYQNRHGLTSYKDIEIFLDCVDAVVIATETKNNYTRTIQAARRGKHILCEKPLATNLDDLYQMQDTVFEKNATFMTAFPCPYSKTFARILEKTKQRDIGRILAISGTNRGICPGGWFLEPELSGGGAMMDHTVHLLDLYQRILGENPTDYFIHANNHRLETLVEDTAIISLEYPSGVIATIDCSWAYPESYKTWGDVTLKIVGEDGTITTSLFDQHLEFYPSTGLKAIETGSNLFGRMIDEFVSAILENRLPKTSFHDGKNATEFVLKAYQNFTAHEFPALNRSH